MFKMFYIMAHRGFFAAICLLLAVFPFAQGKLSGCGVKQPRKFELTLTWEKHAPDGFERDMILVNGQFPGPLLEMNQGDDVEVLVHNKMPHNTTVHFHGMYGIVLSRNTALSLITFGRDRNA